MKRFLYFFVGRLTLFFLPIGLLLALPLWVLWVSGEMMLVDKIIEKQQHLREPMTVGLAYSNPAKYYKLHSLMARHPRIAVFGSSHVMPFREDFFGKKSFYNAAVGGSRLPDFENFITNIPKEKQPEVLIVGLDPFFAQPNFDWSQKEEERFDRRVGMLDAVRILGTSWKNVYQDYFQKKFSIRMLAQDHRGPMSLIGLEAVARGNGFLNDGSYFNKKKPAPFSGTVQDYSYLKGGESFNERGLPLLESFLDVCRRRNIHLIGILPPVRQAVYDQLHVSGYRYLEELPRRLEPLFKSRGFSLHDFSNPRFFGGNDDEFHDDFHASEAAYRRITVKLFEFEMALRG